MENYGAIYRCGGRACVAWQWRSQGGVREGVLVSLSIYTPPYPHPPSDPLTDPLALARPLGPTRTRPPQRLALHRFP